ncbi:venom protein 302-like [Amblyomma americanum]
MKTTLCATLLFVGLVALAESMPSCPDCLEVECPLEEDCAYGVTSDTCGCCKVCASGPGEECGGYLNHGGTCAEGLTCRPNLTYYQLPGKCVHMQLDSTS